MSSISTDKNESYGGTLVNQKYAPLLNPVADNANRSIYTGMLNNRSKLLNNAGLLAAPLGLVTPGWAGIVAAEVTPGRQPPLVVVSSNRAGWIRAGINACEARVQELANSGLPPIANVSDLRALSGSQPISPPLYAPIRVGADRGVYIVVHAAEYAYYKDQLDGTGVVPVGWKFLIKAGVKGNLEIVGFGATRFAAMEFCKNLRRRAAAANNQNAPWDSAWLIDDNTVALTSFPGFTAVENALGANACAGFQGGTQAEARDKNREMAAKEVSEGRGTQTSVLPPSAPPGIVQQTALWNIDYFETQNLNFGPAFIASAEDLSITNYFNGSRGKGPYPYQWYGGIGVRKEQPAHDDKTGAQSVNQARAALTAWVTNAENDVTAAASSPPPPVMVTPVKSSDGGEQTLPEFIVNAVLPNAAAVKDKAKDAATQATAKSQAVEQIVSGALNKGFVDPPALNATFKINGTKQQAVQMVDK